VALLCIEALKPLRKRVTSPHFLSGKKKGSEGWSEGGTLSLLLSVNGEDGYRIDERRAIWRGNAACKRVALFLPG
jgi:hypothetical protein